MRECGTQRHGLVNIVIISEDFSILIDSVIPWGSGSGVHVLRVLHIL